MYKKKLKAEVTVFLSLLMIVMLAFITALVESGTIQVAKSYARGEADRSVESVFAEYQQELLEHFGIFAIDATYETGKYKVSNVLDRLNFYGSDSMEWEVNQLQLLSDKDGAAYEEQMIAYMEQRYGLTYLETLGVDIDAWEVQKTEGESTTWDFEESTESLLEQTNVEEETLNVEGTALENVMNLQQMDILTLVLGNQLTISDRQVESSQFASNRSLNEGISSYSLTNNNGASSQIMVNEYVLEQFQSAIDTDMKNVITQEGIDGQSLQEGIEEESLQGGNEEELSQDGLQYELEYILTGKDSDRENLKSVVNQLLFIRTGINYTFLQQSVTKRAEASALALTIASASAMPVLQPAIEQALLLGWAYGESVLDIRCLLEGKAVPLVKTDLNWQLSLTGLMALGTEDETYTEVEVEEGINYEDYLRILMYLESKDNVVVRALDMVEQRMQLSYGCSYFQVDYCVTQLECSNTSTVMGTFTYTFPVSFGYQ